MASETPDISQLTAVQQEALQTYTAVTDQDPIAAIPLLQRSQWNVQIAITRFYEGEPTTDLVAEAQAAATSYPAPSARQQTNLEYESLLAATRSPLRPHLEDTAPRIDTTSPQGIPTYQPPLLLSLLFTPVNILYRVFNTILSPFSFLIPNFVSRLLSNIFSQHSRPSRRALPPSETAHRFIRELNETYPTEPSEALPWSETGYNLALDNAKTNQKFLLIVLLSYSHDETHAYVTDILQSQPFREFIATHRDDIILWGGNVQDAEAYKVSNALSCSKFPFAALVCQTPNSPTATSASGGNMTVIARLVGLMQPAELVAKLGTAVTNHKVALRAARAQRAEHQAQRNLRQEQDSAYERSLAQDRERARKRKEEEEMKANAEKEALRKHEEAEQLKHKGQQWKKWRAQSLSAEPGTAAKDTVRVSIRMHDGQRVIRKFTTTADLEELYAFVECYDLVKQREEGSKDGENEITVAEPKGYEHEYKFQLVSPMPRTVYALGGGGTVIDRVGKGANLIVESMEEDEDEDEDEELEIEGNSGVA